MTTQSVVIPVDSITATPSDDEYFVVAVFMRNKSMDEPHIRKLMQINQCSYEEAAARQLTIELQEGYESGDVDGHFQCQSVIIDQKVTQLDLGDQLTLFN